MKGRKISKRMLTITIAVIVVLGFLFLEEEIEFPSYLTLKARTSELFHELVLNTFAFEKDSAKHYLAYSEKAQIVRLLNWIYLQDSERRIQELKQWRYFNRLDGRDTECVYENLLALSDRFISPVRDERRTELQILIEPLEIGDRSFILTSADCSRYWTRRLDYKTLLMGTAEERRNMYKKLPELPSREQAHQAHYGPLPCDRRDHDLHYYLLCKLLVFESDRENRLILIRKMHEGEFHGPVKKGELFEATDYCGEARLLMFNEEEIRQREQEMAPYIVGSEIPPIDELRDYVVYSKFDEDNQILLLEEAADAILSTIHDRLGFGYAYHYLSKLRGEIPQEVRLQAWLREGFPPTRKELLLQWLSEQEEMQEKEWARTMLLEKIEQRLQESIAKRIAEIDKDYERLPEMRDNIQLCEERSPDSLRSFGIMGRQIPEQWSAEYLLDEWAIGHMSDWGREPILHELLKRDEFPGKEWTKARASEILKQRSQESVPDRMAELDEVYELLPERHKKFQADKEAFEKAINDISVIPEDSIVYELIAPKFSRH